VTGSNPTASNHRRLLLGSAAVVKGAAIACSLSTQFIAWRVRYHPALGVPWAGHFYAPWKWIEWQASAWAPNAEASFRVVDAGLLAVTALAMFGAVAASIARRRRPIRHEGVHGTARFQAEQELRRGGLLPRRTGAPRAGVYIGGWTDPKGTTLGAKAASLYSRCLLGQLFRRHAAAFPG